MIPEVTDEAVATRQRVEINMKGTPERHSASFASDKLSETAPVHCHTNTGKVTLFWDQVPDSALVTTSR